MNFAGILYNIGNAVQIGFGTLIFSPRQLVSSVLLIVASSCFAIGGHKKWGVPAGCSLSFFGILLAAWPGLADLEAGTIFGFLAITPSILVGVFSVKLRQAFSHHRNGLIRETLGHPRRVMALTALFLSRIPIIYEDALHIRWDSLIVFSIWASADIFASMSDIG